MTGRIFLKFAFVAMALLALAGAGAQYLVSRITEQNFRADLEASLAEKTRMARTVFESEPEERYRELAVALAADAHARVTVIRNDGQVVADSGADASTMENHAARAEFAAALGGREGVSRRISGTVKEDLLYYAVPMRGGAVRLALPIPAIEARVAEVRGRIVRVVLVALAPALALALLLARRFSNRLSLAIGYSQRLAKGDFQARIPEMGAGELGELAATLQRTGEQLRSMFEQLQEERSRFAAAVNGIGEGILVADRKLRAVLFNPAMEQMLPQARLFKGASLEEWDNAEIPELFRRVLDSGEAYSVEVQVHEPVDRSWKVSCAPIVSRKGKVQAVVAVFYDITELDRVDRMRKDFVINVSHELRTPLAAIQGYAETLLDGAIDDPGVNRRFMKILWQNAERLAQLTADLMTLSQIEVKTREFAFSPHPVAELVQQAGDSIRGIAEKKGIRVETEPPNATLVCECDSGAIHQILNNLLDNAVKYTPEGGAIALGARQRDGRVEYFVRDTGAGIPAEHIPRLFERFYRVDKARSRELGGTGLGLAIVKHLVLAHRGTVRVESEPGRGSTFYFELPLRQPSTAPQIEFAQRSLF
jgi:two-component system, OmpR family, phosphate regulon sensor histidine kinase PhoR